MSNEIQLDRRVLSYGALIPIIVSLTLADTAIDRFNVSPSLFNLHLGRSLAEY